MSHTPHELIAEFPEHADRIHTLKVGDAHFAKLYDEYHEINRRIHRAETNIDPVEEIAEVEMRKTRMRLKDELYAMLTAAEA